MKLSGKSVVVTGACGFIGSHLVEHLVSKGCEVTAFVYYNSFNSWGWLDTLDSKTKKQIQVVSGDIRDVSSLERAFENKDICFHLAALIAIPYSYESPDSYVSTNVQGTLNVLNSARRFKLERVIHLSTSEVYGTAEFVPIHERHPLKGQSPYSASKIGADMMAESFARSFELPVAIARPFNTYGPRQSARAIIPTVMTQILSGKDKIQLGSAFPTRDFTFVKDTAEGIAAIAECDSLLGGVTNIGSNFEISIEDLVNRIKKVANSNIEIQFDPSRARPEKSEVERLWADASRLEKNTSWKPQTSIDDGLNETFQWLGQYLERYKPDVYNK